MSARSHSSDMSIPVRNQKGFTLIEIVLVVMLLGILIAISTQIVQFNLPHIALDTLSQQVISDIKNQQMTAISGVTPQSGAYVDYSIRFEEHRYIMYPGLVYQENNPENTVVILDDGYVFSDITFPSGELSFSRLSGDVRNYSSAQNSVSIMFSQTNEKRVITVNKRGVLSVE
jgi:prepilin-type N-terminal cleavage/methylation domain-containing protein